MIVLLSVSLLSFFVSSVTGGCSGAVSVGVSVPVTLSSTASPIAGLLSVVPSPASITVESSEKLSSVSSAFVSSVVGPTSLSASLFVGCDSSVSASLSVGCDSSVSASLSVGCDSSISASLSIACVSSGMIIT